MRVPRTPRLAAAMALMALAFASSPAAADATWDATVKAALAEGEVDVHGGPGVVYEEILTEGFHEAFPQIEVNFSGLSGREAIPKIVRERAAGIYNWDVYVGGTLSVLEGLRPIGALAPFKPNLILPEVLDDKAWQGGLDAGFMDKDHKYLYGFASLVTPTVMVNWDDVRHDDLKTYADLLKPEFSGKIVWDDPRLPGSGNGTAMRFLVNFGPDYLKRLLTQQRIVYITNVRENAEWVVRGRYPIGFATTIEDLQPFRQQGLGKDVAPFDPPVPHPMTSTGFGTISMLSHPPHPNAAKVYVNWLLSKAGQREWQKTGYNSRRLDIPHVDDAHFPKPGVAYVADQSEANEAAREQALEMAKKYIGTQE